MEPKEEPIDDNDDETAKCKSRRKKKLVYANVNFNRNAFLPWRICRYHRRTAAANDVKNDALIEIDSDNEDGVVRTIPINEDLNASISANCTIKDFGVPDDTSDEEHTTYHIVESRDSTIGVKKIPDYYMAKYDELRPDVELPSRMRVIARRKSRKLPYTTSQSSGERHFIYVNDQYAFYAGIVGCNRFQRRGQWVYLVFFDDGHVQYVSQRNIRTVYSLPQFKHVHPNAKKFCEYYFNGPQMEQVVEIKAKPGQAVIVHVNGQFERASVLEIRPKNSDKPQLFHLYFEKWNRYEWIYTGSPRLEKIWKFMTLKKGLWQFNPEADTSTYELSSDSEDELELPTFSASKAVDSNKTTLQIVYKLDAETIVHDYQAPPKRCQRHKSCTNGCVVNRERDPIIFQYAPLDRPILCGWKRQKLNDKIEYTAPCGRRFKGIQMISKFLINVNSTLTIDCFSFDKHVRCLHEKRTEVHGESNGICMLNDVSDIDLLLFIMHVNNIAFCFK